MPASVMRRAGGLMMKHTPGPWEEMDVVELDEYEERVKQALEKRRLNRELYYRCEWNNDEGRYKFGVTFHEDAINNPVELVDTLLINWTYVFGADEVKTLRDKEDPLIIELRREIEEGKAIAKAKEIG